MDVHVFASAANIAEFVVDRLAAQLAAKPASCIGLTTGTTPLATGLFREAAARANAGRLSLSSATVISPDEFLGLPAGHEESYYAYTRRHLLDQLPAVSAPARWIIPNSDTQSPEEECAMLENGVREAGGLDFQLLGIGLNGHVAFIEPAESLPSQCYVTPIAESNRQLYASDFGGDVANVPTHAVTYGVRTLMAARRIVLIAVGSKKAEILARALRGPVTTMCPASLLQLHPAVTVVVDEAAAPALFAAELPAWSAVKVVRHPSRAQ